MHLTAQETVMICRLRRLPAGAKAEVRRREDGIGFKLTVEPPSEWKPLGIKINLDKRTGGGLVSARI